MRSEEFNEATHNVLEAKFALDQVGEFITDEPPGLIVKMIAEKTGQRVVEYMCLVERLLAEYESNLDKPDVGQQLGIVGDG
ncbi:MAG: hypothetical protein DRQ61_09860 [Gammaproteobacteria bacterium]|nr:MAG: hypothetical protein DRQ56_07035 [Gammaproteobacteria bacterium]RLA20525.1 MAG: hypothetical protein DRQ61_09860 [Gammaproteobacteria bacterium]